MADAVHSERENARCQAIKKKNVFLLQHKRHRGLCNNIRLYKYCIVNIMGHRTFLSTFYIFILTQLNVMRISVHKPE